MTDYNLIAKDYADTQEKRIGRKYVINYTFFKFLGDIKSKDVLDIGCGNGFLTRDINLKGANKVVGTDLSKEMIRLAKEKEKQNPLGITYYVEDMIKLPELGKFDIVTAGLVIHYSKTKQELLETFKNIYKNLKQGGKLIAINNNPDSPLTYHKEYSSTVEPTITPLKEGDPLKVTLYIENEKICSFNNYHWNKTTYETAMRQAGFKKIIWHDLEVSEEGIKRFGKDFWKGLYEDKYITILEAWK